MPVKKLTPKQIESIRQQAQSGTSVAALCAKYNLSSTHIYRMKERAKGHGSFWLDNEKYDDLIIDGLRVSSSTDFC